MADIVSGEILHQSAVEFVEEPIFFQLSFCQRETTFSGIPILIFSEAGFASHFLEEAEMKVADLVLSGVAIPVLQVRLHGLVPESRANWGASYWAFASRFFDKAGEVVVAVPTPVAVRYLRLDEFPRPYCHRRS